MERPVSRMGRDTSLCMVPPLIRGREGVLPTACASIFAGTSSTRRASDSSGQDATRVVARVEVVVRHFRFRHLAAAQGLLRVRPQLKINLTRRRVPVSLRTTQLGHSAAPQSLVPERTSGHFHSQMTHHWFWPPHHRLFGALKCYQLAPPLPTIA
jgi:hypothetical protein